MSFKDNFKKILLIGIIFAAYIAFKAFFSSLKGLIGLAFLLVSFVIFKNTMSKHTGDKMKKHLIIAGCLFCLGSIMINFPLGILMTLISLVLAFMTHNITVSNKNVNIILPKNKIEEEIIQKNPKKNK